MTKETDFPSAAEVLNYKLTNGGFVVSGAKCSVIAKELLKRHILLFATIKNSEKGFIYRYDESGVYLPMQERELKKNHQRFSRTLRRERCNKIEHKRDIRPDDNRYERYRY